MESSRLPFRIGSLYAGCAKVDGFIVIRPEYLVLEYRVSDKFVGMFSGPIITRRVAWQDLQGAEYRLGFFMPSLTLSARTLGAFDQFPAVDGSKVRLQVRWRDRHQLRALISQINLHLSYEEVARYRYRLPGDF